MSNNQTQQTKIELTPEAAAIIEKQKESNKLLSYTKGLTDGLTFIKLIHAQGLHTTEELNAAISEWAARGWEAHNNYLTAPFAEVSTGNVPNKLQFLNSIPQPSEPMIPVSDIKSVLLEFATALNISTGIQMRGDYIKRFVENYTLPTPDTKQ